MKLALGTVQFGLSYGAFNQNGMPAFDQILQILDTAKALNFDLLDTAQAYGESESRIGRSGYSKSMKIVTKIPPLGDVDLINLDSVLEKSLTDLGVSKVYGLLFHRLEDIKKIGIDNVVEWIRKIKLEGTIEKWGVSIYGSDEIDYLLNNLSFDLIQLPLNIFDQRLTDAGYLKKLKKNNIEIHVRSIFLQGLLLNFEKGLSPFFDSMGEHFNKYSDFLRIANVSSLDACLAFVNSISEIDYAVIGVESIEQLESIYQANERAKNLKLDFKELAWIGESKFLNPGKWNQ